MHVVLVQSTALPSKMAHWVQILNTAHALARQQGTRVTIVCSRLSEPADDLLRSFGFAPLPTLAIVPMAPEWAHRRLGLDEDFLDPARQRWWGRWIARRTLGRVLRSEPGPVMILTREQKFHTVFGDLLPRGTPTVCELHKFEYVKAVQKRLARRKEGRRTLAEAKALVRARRDEEVARLCRFNGIVCTTRMIREQLLARGCQRPTVLLPNGANLEFGRHAAAGAAKDVDVLYVGQLYRWKNVDLLVEAMAHLAGRNLTVVGGNDEDDLRRVRAVAERCGVADRVAFLGHRPHSEVASFMARARLGAIPLPRAGFPEARFYTCPLKALELMAAGVPIVASRLPALEGLLEDGANAVLVKPDDAQALADGMARLLADEELQQRLVANGRAFAQENSYDARARRLLEFAEACDA